MTARILTALCLSLALAGANAQTTPPAPPAPKPAAGDEAKSAASDTPPDEKAYREAGKMADPEKKIAALEGIKKDFPDSRYVSAANWQIFNTLIQKMPDQKERIRKAAKALFAASVAKDRATSRENKVATMASRGSTAERIADQLTTAGLLLKDAESYARRSEKALSENVWMAEQRAAYAREKMNVPSQEAMAKDFAETRASRIGTLGRVGLELARPPLTIGPAVPAMTPRQGNIYSPRVSAGVPRTPPTWSLKLSTRRATTAAWTAWKPCWTRSTASAFPTRSTGRRTSPPRSAATVWCWPKCSPARVAGRAPAPMWPSMQPWNAIRARISRW